MSINWNNIRPFQASQNEAFEELVCQLAKKEKLKNAVQFIRKGKPDAGVECFWILKNGKEHTWQAKFFTASLSTTQWNELDSSVKTALDKHPNLERYIIAIPYDPPDARLKGEKSMLVKWNERVKKWTTLAASKGMNVEFEAWWSSDLIGRLQQSDNTGLTYFWFNKEEFTDIWFSEQNEYAITDLGNRYTPELNVELDISKIFDGIGRDAAFREELRTIADDFFVTGKRILRADKKAENSITSLSNYIDTIFGIVEAIDFDSTSHIQYDDILEILHKLLEKTEELKELYSKKDEAELKSKSTKIRHVDYGYERYAVNTFESSTYTFQKFLRNTACKLSNNPYLLLNGEAGIGKSHLIADVVTRRNNKKQYCLLLLGQYFVTDEDPWRQISKKLDIKCSINEFLGSLNAKAEASKSRLIIFIDALNEGRGRYFWSASIKSFVKKIKKYEWLGLVVSVRTTYKKLIFPEDLKHHEFLLEYTHYGFRDHEFEASKIFFENYYGIEPPNIPLLHPEFQNPLFLKLFCEGLKKSGHTRVPDGLQGITTIINFFIGSVNTTLSKPGKCDYSEDINLVKKVIDALIDEKVTNNLRYIDYERATIIANNIISPYSSSKRFLDELIHEGILAQSLHWVSDDVYKEAVYLSYERFEDHLIAMYLLEKQKDINKAFAPGGELYSYVKDRRACYLNQGIIEALTVQLPEKSGKELFDFAPQVKDEYPIAEAFINGLIWRKTNTLSKHLLDYVNTVVLKYNGTRDLFWETLLALSAVPGHFFNAYSLHDTLMRKSMSERDAWWTQYLKYKYEDNSSVKRLIDWAWSDTDKSHISDEAIKLSCITLAWLHTSTNRKLRDYATKALISLLKDRIHLLTDILKLFKDVNDPYVYERLFAVAYGSALRTKDKDLLPGISKYIFETIFNAGGEVYPNVLLRDYARGVIEYTAHLEYKLGFDIKKARPPYKSTFPKRLPTDKTILKKYDTDRSSDDFKEYHRGQSSILSSMAVEYSKRDMYGDFGRYTFESGLRYWNLDTNALSNLAIKWIFEKYGYDASIHGEFDSEIGTGRGRNSWPNERIGKKYQWIAFYEILARVSDNFPMYSSKSYYRTTKDIETYGGPWSPYVRDIDPTTLIKGKIKNEHNLETYWWQKETYSNWHMPDKKWVEAGDDLPNAKNLISVTDTNGEEWLVLESFPEWEQEKALGVDPRNNSRKLMWYMVRSYLIPKKNFKKVTDWAVKQDFMGRWMPENADRYEVFNREYYWSHAYDFFKQAYYDGLVWRTIRDQESDKIISKAMVASDSYMWEEENDASKEDTIRILMPCNSVFHTMGLRYSDNEGEFLDSEGNVVCFEASVYHNCKQCLLIKKKPFTKYLNDNNLEILWTVIGEKNVIGGSRNDYVGRLEISGAYYIKDGIINGTINTKID